MVRKLAKPSIEFFGVRFLMDFKLKVYSQLKSTHFYFIKDSANFTLVEMDLVFDHFQTI